MPLPTSGQISFGDLRNEFAGGNPVYFSQYYRNAGRVPDYAANAGIPTSGTIYLSQFRGASASPPSSALSVSAPDVMRQVNNGTASGSSVASGSGGSGGYTYTWQNNSGATMSVSGATATFSSTRSLSGSATVTVRDSSGATATKTIIVELAVGRPI